MLEKRICFQVIQTALAAFLISASKYGSLLLTIYVQYAFINALAKLANEWCAL
jgi:hypothetical protein